MDKLLLKQKIKAGLTTRELANNFNVSQTTIRYWLKKYNLKTKHLARPRKKSTGKCLVCQKNIKENNICAGCSTKIRRYRNKREAVRIKGGKCEICGWTGPIAGFDFHHKDPSKKDFEIGNVANKAWTSIKKEIKKCRLLCRNCHSILHSSTTKNFLKVVENYKGNSF